MRANSTNCNLAAHKKMQFFAFIRTYLQAPSSAEIASFLLFEMGFVKALIALGTRYASARKTQ